MKRILFIAALLLTVTAGYPQSRSSRPSSPARTSSSYSTTRTQPSVSRSSSTPASYNRTPSSSVSKPQATRQPSSTARYTTPQRQATPAPKPATTTRAPWTAPSKPSAPAETHRTTAPAPQKTDYSKRPGVSENRVNQNMPDHYAIPEKPRTEPATSAGQEKCHPGGPAAPHHHTYGHIHHVPQGMHPRPPMYHPIHHHRHIFMTYRVCNDWMYHEIIWRHYWHYTHHWIHEPSMVIMYVNSETPANTLLDYVVTDNMVFSLYRDNYDYKTYFAITDEYDNTLARVSVGRKYTRLMADENGVWVLSRSGNSAKYFMYIDGRLYMYDNN